MKKLRLALGVLSVSVLACGDSGQAGGSGGSGGSGGVGGAGGSTENLGAGGSSFVVGGNGGGQGCGEDGAPCDDNGGVCAGGECCSGERACGSTCCAGSQVCSFLQCVTPGAVCVDATDCADDEYCEYALGEPPGMNGDPACEGGVTPATGKCLPKPPQCAEGEEPGDPITCLAKCEYQPPIGELSPVLKYAWGDPAAANTQDSVMMAPIVIQLDDDTCDDIVDERDIPEIVFFTFAAGNYNGNGTLHAISIVDGAVVEKWTANAGATSPNHPGRSIAGGNIDGIPGNEVVVCTTDGRVRAYASDGTQLWLSPAGTCTMPSLADLDQDGDVEVIADSQVLDGVTGTAEVAAMTPANAQNMVAYDMTGDGLLDLVTPERVYASDGTLIADSGVPARYVALGDLDKDGVPEVVASDYNLHALVIWHLDPNAPGGVAVLRQGIDINGVLNPNLCAVGSAGNTRGGGPPTVADFNGDGFPDVALAGGVGYAVFDGTKLMDPAIANNQTFLWVKQTQDCSSAATGSSVFDFDGDGAAEVVYGDERLMHVYDGATGTTLFETCNTNGTLFEYPLVADVDSDGQADIVVVSNSYSSFNCSGVKTSGVRVFGDANGNWVRTRRVWNQHPYHVTNIEEDGTVPTIEAPNHLQPKLNNYRQNVQPLGEFSAPDLVVSVFPKCDAEYGVFARVRNIGEAAVPAGVAVNFYVGDPQAGGVSMGGPLYTTQVLYPAEAEDILLLLPDPPDGVQEGTVDIYATVDEDGNHTWHECRTDNNQSAAGNGKCNAPT